MSADARQRHPPPDPHPSPDPHDPKGLVREAYRLAGIGAADCRSILIDWALSLPAGADACAAAAVLADRHAALADHPMTQVLREGRAPPPAPRRRGGRAGRARG